ncbi:MAG TPA: HEPN domain-containing protein [Candidatus Binataceae bacterium]|nr:HEPN domain-containing protein [Candidatus Binataceae bacterium]
MRDDPARVADTVGWLRKAKEDLDIAEELLKPAKTLAGGAVFHYQQAAEKSLKAFLVWHDVPFRKTHDLKELGDACVKIEPTLNEAITRAVPLTEYAWKFRYLGEPVELTREEAEASFAAARSLYSVVVSRLPDDVKP